MQPPSTDSGTPVTPVPTSVPDNIKSLDKTNNTHINNVPSPPPRPSNVTLDLPPQTKDYRSSLDGLQFSKSTDQITYTWNNLNVWTSGKTKQELDKGQTGCCRRKSTEAKHLLKNVSGIVRPGELLAIMGASGAGKSTFLNVLNFRNLGQLKVSGECAVNGVKLGPNSLTSVSAYIQQDDLFIGTLTVREHLIFQALVRMHRRIPYKARIQRVEEVIQQVGLSKCADTIIGTPGRLKGISGGEMKRLSFASEVLTDPPLMFCDEPTSGLDSYMSQNVINVLKNLSNDGKTIICTIHQPSSQIFESFDRIFLLAEGRVAFMGDTSKALEFFKDKGFTCPENYNPADFYIQTLAIQPTQEGQCREKVNKICDAFDTSPEANEIQTLIQKKSSDPKVAAYLEREAEANYKSPYKASWIAQFRAVFWRSFFANIKDPVFIRLKIIQTLSLSFIVGLVYLGQKFDQHGVQNIGGAIFMVIMNVSFGTAFSTIDVFCLELPVFLREHFNGMYRTDVYFLSKMFAEVPFHIFFPALSTAIVYFMIGLQPTAEAFFLSMGIYVLCANCAVSVGYMVSCIAPTVSVALGIGPAILVPLAIFGGLFLNSGSVPIYFIWLKYISWFFYANEALTVIQWRHVEHIECLGGPIGTCPPNGTAVIKNLGFKEENLVADFLCLVALLIGYRILAFLALLTKTFGKK